jgi:hypothetical protein
MNGSASAFGPAPSGVNQVVTRGGSAAAGRRLGPGAPLVNGRESRFSTGPLRLLSRSGKAVAASRSGARLAADRIHAAQRHFSRSAPLLERSGAASGARLRLPHAPSNRFPQVPKILTQHSSRKCALLPETRVGFFSHSEADLQNVKNSRASGAAKLRNPSRKYGSECPHPF